MRNVSTTILVSKIRSRTDAVDMVTAASLVFYSVAAWYLVGAIFLGLTGNSAGAVGNLADIAILGGCGFFLQRYYSRFAAIIAVINFGIGVVLALKSSNSGVSIFLNLVVAYAGSRAVEATYKLHSRFASEIPVDRSVQSGVYETASSTDSSSSDPNLLEERSSLDGSWLEAAKRSMGTLSADGQGALQTDQAKVSSYLKAAEQGSAPEQYNLGLMYVNGQGVLQDDQAAAGWFHKAAEQGLADAQNKLGMMYTTGRGVSVDLVEAHKWFNLASAGGNPVAGSNRRTAEASMTPEQIARAQAWAREWLAARK
jgi:hypothetical protein